MALGVTADPEGNAYVVYTTYPGAAGSNGVAGLRKFKFDCSDDMGFISPTKLNLYLVSSARLRILEQEIQPASARLTPLPIL